MENSTLLILANTYYKLDQRVKSLEKEKEKVKSMISSEMEKRFGHGSISCVVEGMSYEARIVRDIHNNIFFNNQEMHDNVSPTVWKMISREMVDRSRWEAAVKLGKLSADIGVHKTPVERLLVVVDKEVKKDSTDVILNTVERIKV